MEMSTTLGFLYKRISEKLWIRPLLFSLFAVLATICAAMADSFGFERLLPRVDQDTVEKLLSIIAASMLGVATFAVGSMVSAYSSVSSSATPRAFALVVADDVSKTALSTFVASFIFSVIALVAIKSGAYGRAGLFFVFVMTIAILAWVVFTFVRWVDQIARLGRIGTTIQRVEEAAEAAIERRRRSPTLGASPPTQDTEPGDPLFSKTIGYVQQIDIAALQKCAEKNDVVVTVAALPGAFVGPGRPLAYLQQRGKSVCDQDTSVIANAFFTARERSFDEDPRFGLIALSEIAARALSPAVNDPGTAISIIGTFVRLLDLWVSPLEETGEASEVKFDRVRVPALSLEDMFDDAFTAIARDGAGDIEVVIRLQKAFISLSAIDHAELKSAAKHHSERALARSELALKLSYEIEWARVLAGKVA
jgi:uncharacterized membrane protein